jgi:hypothetical protein
VAITTFVELKTAVDSFLHRTDLQNYYTTFIDLTEADIRSDIKTRAQETQATGTVSSGAIAHPSGLISVNRLVVDDYVLNYVTQAQFAERERLDSDDTVYTSIGTNFYVLTGTDYVLDYVAKFTGLSADSDTNWLLTNYPDVYLYGMLKHAAIWMQDDQATVKFAEMYKGSVSRVLLKERQATFTGGSLAIRPDNYMVV